MTSATQPEVAAPRRDRPTLVLGWHVGELPCAVDVRTVVEVLPPVPCRPMPLAPGWIRGIFAHRGDLVPMVDAAGVLGLPATEDRMANRVLVLRSGGSGASGAPAGDGVAPRSATIGLWVHRVLDLARVDFCAATSHPGLSNVHARFLGPIGEAPWGLVQLVAPHELLDDAQWTLVAGRLAEAAA